MRNWPSAYIVGRAQGSVIRDKFDMTSLPAGGAGSAGALGGTSYGVSRHSLHPREAAMFVRYLCRRDVQLTRSRQTAEPPTIPEVYEDPGVLAANPYFANFKRAYLQGVVLRPSTVAGKKYPELSRAYFEAVHAVLTGRKPAAQAAADLQDRLVELTGLKARGAGANARTVGAATAMQ